MENPKDEHGFFFTGTAFGGSLPYQRIMIKMIIIKFMTRVVNAIIMIIETTIMIIRMIAVNNGDDR